MIFLIIGGLVLLVGLIVVLVVMGMREGRAQDDDWMDDDRPSGRDDQDADGEADRRVAGAPLSAPTSAESRRAKGKGKSEQMGDDDYWATITFDKPKFPWQQDGSKGEQKPAAPDPLEAAEPEPGQPVAGHDGYDRQQYPADGYADQGYNEQGYNDQYAPHGPNDQYAPHGPNDQYSHGQYAGDQYAGQGDRQAPGGYEPEPVAQGWQDDEPLTRFDQPAVRDFDPPYESQPAFDQPAAYDRPTAFDQPAYEPPAFDQPARYDQPAVYDQPAAFDQPSYEPPAYEPPRPAAPQADPLGLPDPFSRPAARADNRDPEATQAYQFGGTGLGGPLGGAPLNTGPQGLPGANPLGTGPQSTTGPQTPGPLGGPLGTGPQSANPLGAGPLGTPSAQPPLGPSSTGPSAPLTPPLGGAPSYGGASDPQPLTGDTDGTRLPTVDELLQRIQADRRKGDGAASSSSPAYGGTPALSDPLNDPLSDGDYVSGRQPSRYDDPLSGSTPYGAEPSYPTAPAYGAEPSPRYDDPLGGGYGQSTPSYGSYQGQSGGEASRYGDFSGPTFPGTTGENTSYGSSASDQQPYSAPYGEQQGQRSTEEWDSYRDYRH